MIDILIALLSAHAVNITLVFVNQGTLSVAVYNGTTCIALFTLNHTESLLVPKGYTIELYSSESFTTNLYEKEHNLYSNCNKYYLVAEKNTTVSVVFLSQTKGIAVEPTSTATLDVMLPSAPQKPYVNPLAVLALIILFTFLIRKAF